MGGGYVGYNYQLNQNFVLGLEGDFQGTINSKSATWYTPAPARALSTTKAAPPANTLKPTPRRRAWTGWRRSTAASASPMIAPCSTPSAARPGPAPTRRSTTYNGVMGRFGYSISKTLSGFDIGAGVEYAFTPNWVGRVEYRYYDFGKAT